MAIIITFSVLMNEFLFVFSTISKTKANVQVISACVVLLFILFCGFIIPPNVIPDYFVWIYWYNPLAWAYRALLVNEYRSPLYSEDEADDILSFIGMVDINGKPMEQEWVLYCFVYMLLHIFLSILMSAIGLSKVRVTGSDSGAVQSLIPIANIGGVSPASSLQLSFKPVSLTFENICYDVTTSTGKEEIRLLHNVNGVFRSGRMTALMGESGAGKTTLMDVIAMRKTSGTVQGEVRLNGFLQDSDTFRRCSAYVEQFDVQTPQLTVRETVLFSSRLRLDERKVKNDEDKVNFADQVLQTLELTSLADCLVGSDEEGGLSFEQRKRLSIAIELAVCSSTFSMKMLHLSANYFLIPSLNRLLRQFCSWTR
jgi:ABC-type lipoprotein export system ATPase subunit